jgi:hypothetical protein
MKLINSDAKEWRNDDAANARSAEEHRLIIVGITGSANQRLLFWTSMRVFHRETAVAVESILRFLLCPLLDPSSSSSFREPDPTFDSSGLTLLGHRDR